jgi:hypothetical protein
MSTVEALSSAELEERGDFDYRPLSIGAVAAAVFGVLSLLVFVAGRDSLESALLLCPIPLVGILIGWRSLVRMRANPGQFTGGRAAAVGVGLSSACLVGGLAYAWYVHATEVPPGYLRTSFAELRPDEIELRSDQAVPADVTALDGQNVFIKGYIRPDSIPGGYSRNITQFLLVRDNNQCCFGDLSAVKYYDQIAVKLAQGRTVDYRAGLFRMGGKLLVHADNATNGAGLPVFILHADHAE